MNQLEHLKALRDKARIQTEQAKAVLKQQGEISESLDRLIGALEGNGSLDEASSAVLSATSPSDVVDLQSVSVSDEMLDQEVVWETEELLEEVAAGVPNESEDKAVPPKLEPIVWEVASDNAASRIGADRSQQQSSAQVGDSEGEQPGARFKFLKLGEEVSREGDDKDSGIMPAVGVAAAGGVAAIAAGAASLIKDKEGEQVDDATVPVKLPIPIPPPTPVTDEDEDTMAIRPPFPVTPPVATAPPVAPLVTPPVATAPPVTTEVVASPKISSNIFFDANSAYLKDSELTKLKVISESLDGAQNRVVKIQGLEDLASSNDFKELLASRRMLAVKKKLAEGGVGDDQITLTEIDLSEEGRILSPPSLTVKPS